MQLVLAIHADRRQTEQIAALLRKRAAVEIVQASDAGEGLQELGDRVPDLILTSPLLSPFDEDVVAEYLRELGSAGAHIQTLRIPMLSMPAPSGSGLFSLRKKKKVEATPDGCDPAIFVEEITQYLARAAEDRKSNSPGSSRSARSSQTATEVPSHPDVVEPYSTTSPQADSFSSSGYHTPVSRDEFDNGSPESAFPIYRPEAVVAPRPAEKAISSYRFNDVSSIEPPAQAYHVDPSADVAPIYQPFDETQGTPFDKARGEPVELMLDPVDVTRAEGLDVQREPVDRAPVYEPPSFINPPRPDTAAPLFQQTESTPIYRSPPVANAPLYPLPSEPVVHVFERPRQAAATTIAADTPDLTMEPSAHAHASLVLDPSQPDAVVADPPFVVHSTEASIPLSESLERAAAELEASSLGEPMPARETERVPMHQLSSIEEIPLPEELAARVERTAALQQSNDIKAAPPEHPTSRDRKHSFATGSGSLLASPIEIDMPALPPTAFAAPISGTAEEPIASSAVAPEPPSAPRAPQPAAEEKPANPKRSASFEAALAAIRKAWDRPRRAGSNGSSTLSLNLNGPTEGISASPEPSTPVPMSSPVARESSVPAVADPIKTQAMEDSSAREVDLTLELDALDDHGGVTVIEPTLSEQVEIITLPVDDDIYELSASPALHDLDADLAAAGPPAPVREVFPPSIVAAADMPAAIQKGVEARPTATPKADKHKKKSDKRKPIKATTTAPTAAAPLPAAAAPPADPQEPAQDEWGLFDPNRCGFAALVDKLNEVTDEKEQKPPRKTTVRVISYG